MSEDLWEKGERFDIDNITLGDTIINKKSEKFKVKELTSNYNNLGLNAIITENNKVIRESMFDSYKKL